jgi:hypothetical protein
VIGSPVEDDGLFFGTSSADRRRIKDRTGVFREQASDLVGLIGAPTDPEAASPGAAAPDEPHRRAS